MTTKTRKIASHVIVYRERREAQNRRFTKWGGDGKLDWSDTTAPEYLRYFGLGEYAGSGVEARVTLKSTLIDLKRERLAEQAVAEAVVAAEPIATTIRPEAAFWLPKEILREMAASGDRAAQDELLRRAVKRANKRAARLAVAA